MPFDLDIHMNQHWYHADDDDLNLKKRLIGWLLNQYYLIMYNFKINNQYTIHPLWNPFFHLGVILRQALHFHVMIHASFFNVKCMHTYARVTSWSEYYKAPDLSTKFHLRALTGWVCRREGSKITTNANCKSWTRYIVQDLASVLTELQLVALSFFHHPFFLVNILYCSLPQCT